MKKFIKVIAIAFSSFLLIAENAQSQNRGTGFNMPPLNPQSPFADMVGNHVGIRVPDYEAAVKWHTEKLDFRVIHEWPYADEKLAYLALSNTNDFWLEILGGGKINEPVKYTDLGKSLEAAGYHHLCMDVMSVDKTLAELKKRGAAVVGQPFFLAAINRKLAFIQDPWGNLIELAEVVEKK